MTCKTCKTSNAEAARFCSNCGAELGDRNGPASRQATQEEEITRQQSGGRNQDPTLVDAARDGLIGSTIAGKYRIDSKLGAGGMGAVYRATRLLIGDEVAVKILHAEQTDPRAAERFRREAQAAARLKHPNAVTIHDFGVTDEGVQYLVMELVDGESLRYIIKEQGPLTPSASVEIIDQVCAALDEAHQHGIIHRDIKPDNIIVKVATAGLRVKVLDFGIAKLRDDNASNLTQTGSILGTPHYMSPEQCLGEDLDKRSDIYSVGIVLYEMLTGLVPFNSPTSAAVVVQQVTQPPPSLRALNVSLSSAVESVVLHALEKQRAARPQTASDLAREFKTAATQPNFRAPTSSIPHTNPPSQWSTSGNPGSGSTPTMVLTDQASGHRLVNPAVGGTTATQIGSKQTSLVILLIVMGAIILLGLGGVAAWAFLGGGEASRESSPGTKPATSAEPRGNSPSGVRITATASSVRAPISIASYQATNAVDGRLNTAWIEGADGPGIGQWIHFDFDREVDLRSLTIAAGYFKSPEIWVQNNRLAAVSLQFADGTNQHHSFPDRMEQQQIKLGSTRTTSVKIIIEEVYFGKDPDTAISEVSFDFGKGDGVSQLFQSSGTPPSATSNYYQVEARIVSGRLIGSSDLAAMSAVELQRLRNAIFARHGRTFNTPAIQNYFASKSWYAPRGDYSDGDLTSEDRANFELITSAESLLR